jgi:hypothetical protein
LEDIKVKENTFDANILKENLINIDKAYQQGEASVRLLFYYIGSSLQSRGVMLNYDEALELVTFLVSCLFDIQNSESIGKYAQSTFLIFVDYGFPELNPNLWEKVKGELPNVKLMLPPDMFQGEVFPTMVEEFDVLGIFPWRGRTLLAKIGPYGPSNLLELQLLDPGLIEMWVVSAFRIEPTHIRTPGRDWGYTSLDTTPILLAYGKILFKQGTYRLTRCCTLDRLMNYMHDYAIKEERGNLVDIPRDLGISMLHFIIYLERSGGTLTRLNGKWIWRTDPGEVIFPYELTPTARAYLKYYGERNNIDFVIMLARSGIQSLCEISWMEKGNFREVMAYDLCQVRAIDKASIAALDALGLREELEFLASMEIKCPTKGPLAMPYKSFAHCFASLTPRSVLLYTAKMVKDYNTRGICDDDIERQLVWDSKIAVGWKRWGGVRIDTA